MKIEKPLQTLVRIGTLAFAFSTAVTAAADCDDETDIIGGGFFSASCSSGAVDGEAIGSSNAATGSITAQVFALQLGPEALAAYATRTTSASASLRIPTPPMGRRVTSVSQAQTAPTPSSFGSRSPTDEAPRVAPPARPNE
jgi:hypothetical protein